MSEMDIAVVGVSCRLPGAADPAEFWRLLAQGRSAIAEPPEDRWARADLAGTPRHGGFLDRVDEFDADFFGIAPREAAAMDPQQRLALELSWEALEDAGITPDAVRGEALGVLFGVCADDYAALRAAAGAPTDHRTLTGQHRGIIANRVSHFLGATGPSLVVDTGQSSSLVAVHLGCEALRSGDADTVLVGGVNLNLSPATARITAEFGALSPDGRCHAFDERANGYVRGEGGAVVVLKPLARAVADGDDVYCVIRGSATNSGAGDTLTTPDGAAQQQVLRRALARAGVDPAAVHYLEAHGTGTAVGDPVEAASAAAVYGVDRPSGEPLRLGSVKTNIGHLEGAAGIAGLLKVVLALRHRQLPASLNFRTPHPRIPMDEWNLRVQRTLEPWPSAGPLLAAVSSWGMGGANCHVVLSDHPAPESAGAGPAIVPWVLSAHGDDALRAQARRLASIPGDLDPADVGHALATARAAFAHRAVVLGRDSADLRRGLTALAEGRPAASLVRGRTHAEGALAVLFPGQGAQRLGAGRDLYEATPVFATAFDACLRVLDPHLDRPLRSVLWGSDPDLLDRTRYAQPALFALGTALYRLLESWRVRADFLLGHSVGELVAAHLAGVWSLEDAARVVCARGRVMDALEPGGAMLAVEATVEQVAAILPAGAEIAAVNGPAAVVVSGDESAVDRVAAACAAQGTRVKRLAVSHAFHSFRMEPALAEFAAVLADVRAEAPRIPVLSNVTGRPLTAAEATAPAYWTDHIRRTVRYGDGLAHLSAHGVTRYVEAGPGGVLAGLTRAVVGPDPVVLPFLPKDRPEPEAATAVAAGLHVDGVPLDWTALFGGPRPRPRGLPTYVFHRRRYWFDTFSDRAESSPTRAEKDAVDSSSDAGLTVDPGAASGPGAALEGDRDPVELVRDHVAAVLGHDDPAAVDQHRVFKKLGFDSLALLELVRSLNTATALDLPSSVVFDHPTPAALAAHLSTVRAAHGSPAPESEAAPGTATRTAVDEPIAIVAMSCRLPGGVRDPEDLWQVLTEGRDVIAPFPESRGWDIDSWYDPDPDRPGRSYVREGGLLPDADLFDADFFGIGPREATAMDPQQRLLLELSWETLERAGIDPNTLRGSDTGVFVGAMPQDYAPRLGQIPDGLSGYLLTGTTTSVASGRIAYTLGLHGPALSVDTACSASLTALHLACRSLRAGETSMALVGGVTVMANPDIFVELSSQRALSPDGRCKAFSARADGTGWSEGAVVVLVERLADARAAGHEVLAVVRGSAINQDGPSNGLTAPNGRAQQRVIRAALEDARLGAADVDAVEAHGTGTALGDPVEAGALLESYGRHRERPLLLGTVKSNIGHTQAAAGLVGVLKMVLALRHGVLPKTLHAEQPSPHIDWSTGTLRLLTEPTPWPETGAPRRAGVSSFGISGTNAHVILEQAPTVALSPSPPQPISPQAPQPLSDSLVRARPLPDSSRQPEPHAESSTQPEALPLPRSQPQAMSQPRPLSPSGLYSAQPQSVSQHQPQSQPRPVSPATGSAVIPWVLSARGEDALYARAEQLLAWTEAAGPLASDGGNTGPTVAVGDGAGRPSPDPASRLGGDDGSAIGGDLANPATHRSARKGGLSDDGPAEPASPAVDVAVRGPAGGLARSADVGWSLVNTRAALEDRAVVIARSPEEHRRGLAALASGTPDASVVRGRAVGSPKVVLVFPGQGPQWIGMGRELLDTAPEFAQQARACDAALREFTGWSVLEVLRQVDGAPDLARVDVVQPVLFTMMVSLARLWRAYGVIPDAVVGHSQGEIAAAYVSGGLPLRDAAMVVALRSQAWWELRGKGAMASVTLPVARIAGRLPDSVAVAAVNSPGSVALAGDPTDLDALLAELVAEGVKARRVPGVDTAGHSAQVDVLRERLLTELAPVAPGPSRIPFYSTVTGGLFDTSAMDAGYWYRNMREPVRFEDATRALLAADHTVFVEASSHPVLVSALLDTADDVGKPVLTVASLRRDEGGPARMLTSVAEAWVGGVTVDWNACFGAGRGAVALPTYPFQRTRFWLTPTTGGDVGAAGLTRTDHPILGAALELADGDGVVLTGLLSERAHPWLSEFAEDGRVVVPLAVFAELAAHSAGRVGTDHLADLSTDAPLTLTAGSSVTVQVVLGAADDTGARQIGVHSRTGDGPWTRHAHATAHPHTPAPSAALLEWPPADAVADTHDGHQIWRVGDEIYTEMGVPAESEPSGPESAESQGSAFGLPPLLLDTVLRLGTGGTPAALRGFSLFAEGATTVRARIVPGSRADDNSHGLDTPAGTAVHGRIVPGSDDDLRAPVATTGNGGPGSGERVTAEADGTDRGARAITVSLFDVLGNPVAEIDSVTFAEATPTAEAIPSDALFRVTWPLLTSETPTPAETIAVLVTGAASSGGRIASVPADPASTASRRVDPGDRDTEAANPFGLYAPRYADLADIADIPDAVLVDLSGHLDVEPAVAQALSLIQDWIEGGFPETSRLVFVTRRAVAIEDDEDILDLPAAAVWGFVRSAQSEHPDRLVLLDLDEHAAPESVRAALASGAAQCAIRAGALRVPRLARVTETVPSAAPFSADGTVLITGATGTLGALLTRHLVTRHGVRHLLAVSRRGPDAPGAAELVAEAAEFGARVTVRACDVADRDQVRALLETVEPPLTAVIHAAGVLDDGVVTDQTRARVAAVLRAKVDAARNLHELAGPVALILYSSMVATLGGPGQTAYGAANAYLDALARHRRFSGLPGVSLGWGFWDERSEMSEHLTDLDRLRMARSGVRPLPSELGTALFDAALRTGLPAVLPVDLDLSAVRERAADGVAPLLRGLVRPRTRRTAARARTADTSLARRLAPLSQPERTQVLVELVRAHAAAVLGHTTPDAVGAAQAFRDAGYDSLTAVELRNRLKTATGLPLPTTLLFDYPTPTVLAAHLDAELRGDQAGPVRPAVTAKAADDDPIVIVAMGCRLPGAVRTPEQLWDLLIDGRDVISDFPEDRNWNVAELFDPDPGVHGKSYVREGGFLYDAYDFDPGFFGISPREALAMDPQQRLLLETAWEMFERAGITPESLRGSDTGVYIGTNGQDYAAHLRHAPPDLEGYLLTGRAASVVSGRVAYTLGLEGPAVTLDTACSSSLVALHWAARALRNGECSLAVAGGVTIMSTPGLFVEFSRQRGLAPDARCKAFATAADGTAWGEGVGLVLLERLSDARRHGHEVLARLAGSATNQDGASNGLSAPNGPSQQRVIRQALADAGLSADQVDAVEAHGTGTRLGDPIEAQALLATYGADRERPLWLGALKSNIGHTQAAAGVAGVIKMVLAMRHGLLPATLHVDEPSTYVDWTAGSVELLTESRPWPDTAHPRRAGISAFGISGTNAHVILEQGDAPESTDAPVRFLRAADTAAGTAPDAEPPRLIAWPFSARTADALRAQAAALAELPAGSAPVRVRGSVDAVPAGDAEGASTTVGSPDRRSSGVVVGAGDSVASGPVGNVSDADGSGIIAPEGVAHALATTRTHFEQRAVAMGRDHADLRRILGACAAGESPRGLILGTARSTARTAFLFAGQGAQTHGMGRALRARFPVFADALEEASAALDAHSDRPLAEVMWGSDPGTLAETGYAQPALFAVQTALARLLLSWGVEPEYVAGHSIGELAAVHVAGALSLPDAARLVAARAGLMRRLPEGGTMVAAEIAPAEVRPLLTPGVDIAAVNGPRAVVLSGEVGPVDELVARLSASGHRTSALRVSHAFHSHRMDPVLAEFRAVAASIAFAEPRIPVVSTVTGQPVGRADLSEPDYWSRQIRSTVLFADAVTTLAGHGVNTFLDIGPTPVLAPALRDCLDSGVTVEAVARRNVPEDEAALTALARLHVAGVPVDWTALYPAPATRVHLPTYPFQRRRLWFDAPDVVAAPSATESWHYRIDWRPVDSASSPAAPTAPVDLDGGWLIVVPAAYADEEFVAAVRTALGRRCVCVEIAPADASALADRVHAALADAEFTGVFSLLALAEQPDAEFDSLTVGSVLTLALIQALGSVGIPLWLATRDTLVVAEGDRARGGAQAAVLGLGRVLALEEPRRPVGLIDLPAVLDEHTAAHLPGALRCGEDQVALRRGVVRARRLRRAAPLGSGWTPRDTVLITGGTGGLGAQIARWAATNGAARLVLASRRGPDAHGARALRDELSALATEVVLVACDTADREAVRALVERTKADGPPMRAVLHAAGVVDFGRIAELTPADLAAAAAGKVVGAQELDRLFRSDDLDAFVLFSSIAATWGSGGQGAYAAANAILDAIAEQRRAAGHRATSIAWGPWAGRGMIEGDEVEDLLVRRGLAPMAPAGAIEAMRRAIGADTAAAVIADVRWERFAAAYSVGRERPLLADLPEVRAAAVTAETVTERNGLASTLAELPGVDRAQAVHAVVRDNVAAVLGHDSPETLPADLAFTDLGFDSMTAVELRDRLTLATGVRLATTVVFDHPSATALAEHLLAELSQDYASVEGELDRLESALSRLGPDDAGERTRAVARMRVLLARYDDGAIGGNGVADATAEEIFDFIDNELGA
nr:type I polyketide synthase [Nocardia takedensis]